MSEETKQESFDEWALVEVMGKSRYGGRVREADVFGVKMVRVDIPSAEGEGFIQTKFFHANSLFCITPVTEAVVRAIAKANVVPPVSRWELPEAKQLNPAIDADCDDDDDY